MATAATRYLLNIDKIAIHKEADMVMTMRMSSPIKDSKIAGKLKTGRNIYKKINCILLYRNYCLTLYSTALYWEYQSANDYAKVN